MKLDWKFYLGLGIGAFFLYLALRKLDYAAMWDAFSLIRWPMGRRYWIRRNGKYSTKVPEATASQIAEAIRRWLVANT